MSNTNYKSKPSTHQTPEKSQLNKDVTFAIRPDLEPPPEEDSGAPSIPFNREAEEAVIGAVMINPESFADLTDLLKPSDFYIHRHSWIFTTFSKLTQRGDPIDYRTVCDELQRMGQLDEVGGPAYLTLLINQVPNSLNASIYARTVKDCATRRGMIAAAGQIATLAYDPKRAIDEVISGALEAVQSQTSEIERRRFIVRDAAFALQPQPPVSYVVDKLITNSSVNVFYGEPGSKKTYSALSLGVCVANGKPWLDFETQRSPVLFIDEESGERRLSRRMGETMRGELCDAASSIQYVSLAGFKLDQDADPVIIQTLIENSGARLVIIDALADLMDGDENDKADVQPVFNHLRKIAENTDSAIVVIHHAGKSGGYRGSSAIKGAVDLMVQVSSENGSKFINFHSEKNRDGGKAAWAAEAVWTEDQFYLRSAESHLGERASASEEYVLRFLTDHGPSLLDDIKDSADICSGESARKAVYRLASAKKIVRANPGEKGSKAKYAIS